MQTYLCQNILTSLHFDVHGFMFPDLPSPVDRCCRAFNKTWCSETSSPALITHTDLVCKVEHAYRLLKAEFLTCIPSFKTVIKPLLLGKRIWNIIYESSFRFSQHFRHSKLDHYYFFFNSNERKVTVTPQSHFFFFLSLHIIHSLTDALMDRSAQSGERPYCGALATLQLTDFL